ncbi:MAG: CARDB domain-containing protein, partial [Candidatus Latescibacteria bacterium]|nr:CARDB domain-containing protein [Candidatus Latescibacterota bacterium]
MKRFWVVFFITFALASAVFPNLAFGQAQPDLLVASDPSGPIQVLNSQSDTVVVAIHNAGTDTTRSLFDILVFMSADSTAQASEKVGEAVISDPLAPGDTLVVDVPVLMPALLSLGDYLWIAQVDAQNGIVESDELNNTRVGNIVQLVLPPSDLVVVSGPTGDTEVNRNAQYTVTLDLQNQGAGPTENPFDVTIYLSADAAFDTTDVAVGTTTISDALSVGTSRSLQISVAIPQTHPLGNFQWLVVLDSGGAESESNELNNMAVGNAVEVVEKLADLIISSPPAGPNGVFRQGAYTVSTQIRNQGTGENTANFDVVIYLSEDLIVGNADDVKVGDVAISSTIAVDSTQSVDVPVTISALQGFRAYHWVAVVDDVKFVAELNEDNNALIGHAVSVVPSPSDLVSQNLSGPTLVMRNGVYPVSVDVVNSGGGATGGAFQVAFYMSADDTVGNSDDVRVGSTTLTDVLAVNERQTLNANITMPSAQDFGEYQLLVVIDATGVEAESDESNNSSFASAPLSLVPSPPDILFVTDPVGPERMFRGVVDTVSMQIRNQGSGDVTGEFDVFVFISRDSTFGDD